ncbi:deoxyhypusine synthase [Haloferax marisrubri]|uniref:Deoxyhypusine synthase n=1 Tax=Haloferax marisrubri TaxID=1544719 RepID=A0A2P4NRA6_9EURY|nr:deoxyhypusine synthase [Haloferax marisrubri]POG55676.1 deoxyhypusine synthase [Haloferax marisrubri]
MSDHDDDGYEMPDREEFQHDPLGHAEVRGGMTVGELVEQYGHAGIGAADVHEAADIYAEMLADDDCTVFMSLAGAMVPTGMRKVVSDLIRDGYVDALVTTGANLTHDAIEAIGGKHHHGRAHPEPSSSPSHGSREHGAEHHGEKTEREHDETLRDEEVDRIYNVYLPQEHFALFESHLRDEVFPALEAEGTVSIAALCRELGRANSEVNDREGIEEDAGVAAAAYEADVPIYCPAVQDSVLGLQAWMYSQTSSFSLDALADMTPLTDLAYDADTAGCLLVGGGVPKNFTLQTMLVTPGAYDYGVQITMDPAATGGLSGATLDEARSWGKLEKDARNATVLGDATIMLPLLVAAARERIE